MTEFVDLDEMSISIIDPPPDSSSDSHPKQMSEPDVVALAETVYDELVDYWRSQQGWDVIGGSITRRDADMDEDQMFREEYVKRSRVLARREPLSKQAVRLYTTYSGILKVEFSSSDDYERLWKEKFWELDENRRVLGALHRRKLSLRLLTDGELFFVLFPNMETGNVTIRAVDPLQIPDIITDPEDQDTPLYYRRMKPGKPGAAYKEVYYRDWQASKKALSRAELPAGASIADKAVIFHVPFDSTGIRGNGLLFAVISYVETFRNFLQDRATIVRGLATYIRTVTVKGGSKAVSDIASRFRSTLSTGGMFDNNPPDIAGSTWVQNQGVDKRDTPPITNAGEALTDARIFRQPVGTGVGITEANLTGDPSIGNLASQAQMEGPQLQNFQDYQYLWEEVFRELWRYVLEVNGIKRPDTELDIDLPQIVREPLGSISNVIFAGVERGLVPWKEGAKQLLVSLGCNQVDMLLKTVEEERKAAQQAQQQQQQQQAAMAGAEQPGVDPQQPPQSAIPQEDPPYYGGPETGEEWDSGWYSESDESPKNGNGREEFGIRLSERSMPTIGVCPFCGGGDQYRLSGSTRYCKACGVSYNSDYHNVGGSSDLSEAFKGHVGRKGKRGGSLPKGSVGMPKAADDNRDGRYNVTDHRVVGTQPKATPSPPNTENKPAQKNAVAAVAPPVPEAPEPDHPVISDPNDLSDPDSRVNVEARKNWGQLSVEEKMSLCDPESIDRSMDKELSRYRKEFTPRFDFSKVSAKEMKLDDLADNALDYIDSLGDALTPATRPILETFVDRYTDVLGGVLKSPGGLPDGVDGKLLDVLLRSNIDKLVFQEIETRRRQLGDHGIRHVVGDVQYSQMIMDSLDSSGISISPMDRFMAAQALVDHDMGYTAGVVTRSVEATKMHEAYSEVYARAQGYDAVFGEEGAERLYYLVRTHAEPDLEWEDDPLASAVRTADNLALFYKEKLPSLFLEVPGAMTSLYKLQLAKGAGSADQKVVAATKKELHALVDSSVLDPRIKDELHMAAEEVFDLSPKFTLGMLGGVIEDMSYADGVLSVNLGSTPDRELLNDMFSLGDRQFTKFTDSYDISGTAESGLILSEKDSKQRVLKLTVIKENLPESQELSKIHRQSLRPKISSLIRLLGESPNKSKIATAWNTVLPQLQEVLSAPELETFKMAVDDGTYRTYGLTDAERSMLAGIISLGEAIHAVGAGNVYGLAALLEAVVNGRG